MISNRYCVLCIIYYSIIGSGGINFPLFFVVPNVQRNLKSLTFLQKWFFIYFNFTRISSRTKWNKGTWELFEAVRNWENVEKSWETLLLWIILIVLINKAIKMERRKLHLQDTFQIATTTKSSFLVEDFLWFYNIFSLESKVYIVRNIRIIFDLLFDQNISLKKCMENR